MNWSGIGNHEGDNFAFQKGIGIGKKIPKKISEKLFRGKIGKSELYPFKTYDWGEVVQV